MTSTDHYPEAAGGSTLDAAAPISGEVVVPMPTPGDPAAL